MADGYYTIEKETIGNYTEKKSEFIAQMIPVSTKEEAEQYIETIKAKHRKARHNVYAYIVQKDHAERYSDDGEPHGTAGTPMMEVLQKNHLTDICCVVTRYFGGVLLGANGLVRAYTKAVVDAIDHAHIKHMCPCYPVTISCDYSLYGKITYAIPEEGILQVDSQFADDVKLYLMVQEDIYDSFCKKMVELSANTVEIQTGALTFEDFSKKV